MLISYDILWKQRFWKLVRSKEHIFRNLPYEMFRISANENVTKNMLRVSGSFVAGWNLFTMWKTTAQLYIFFKQKFWKLAKSI